MKFTKTKGGELGFRLIAFNGQTIPTGGLQGKIGCANGVESDKRNAAEDNRFERLVSKCGSHYFNLKGSNGQVIRNSQMYSSESGMENGISAVMKNTPDDKSEDIT